MKQSSMFDDAAGSPLFSLPDTPPVEPAFQTPRELQEGKLYRYQGDMLAHATIRYEGTLEGYYGTQYNFSVMRDVWQVGGTYSLPLASLQDLTEV
jgi:hypothetical protein